MSAPTGPTVVENKLNDLNRKIVEIKKKIQLSESQRKANFEEYNAKKHENTDKITSLKKELKDLYAEYARTKNNDETTERAAKADRQSSAYAKKRNLEEIVLKIDEDSIRLRKKYDFIKYHSEKRRQKLNSLTQEYENLVGAKIEKLFEKKMDSPLRKRIVSLEVRLEHIRTMQIKANIVRMKYRSERAELKEKSVFYVSSLKDLENDIKEQGNEIKRLEGVKAEAVDLKDSTQETLMKEEVEETTSSKERETVIENYRKQVAERKMELERLERMIFHARPRDDFDMRRKSRIQATEDITKDEVTRLEEAFARLRSATGVSRSEDVLNRFLGQRATKDSLQKMRAATEQEKMDLEKKRQELTAEIEMRKFSETKNEEQNAEKVENLNRQIAEQQVHRSNAEEKKQRVDDILKKITETLLQLCNKLRDATNVPLPIDFDKMEDPLDLLQSLHDQMNSMIETLGGSDQYLETLDEMIIDKLETVSIASTSIEGKTTRTESSPLFPLFPSSAATAVIPSEDEEEVPTRNEVKKQAQLLVDTKSRRKGFNFRR